MKLFVLIYWPDGEPPMVSVYPSNQEARKEGLRIVWQQRDRWRIPDDIHNSSLLDIEGEWLKWTRGNENIWIEEKKLGVASILPNIPKN